MFDQTDFTPPQETREEVRRSATTIKERQGKIRAMYRQHVLHAAIQAKDIGDELNALQEECIVEHKPWLPELDLTGVAQRTAHEYMRLARNWPLLESHFRGAANLGLVEALKYLSETYCRPCLKQGSPKKGCRDCKAMRVKNREPGEEEAEEWEKQIKALASSWKKKLDEARALHLADKETDTGYRALETLQVAYRGAMTAPPRDAKPPADVDCKKCGDPCQFVTTAKGKRVLLEREPAAGGEYAIRHNRAIFVKKGELVSDEPLYKSHYIRCKGKTDSGPSMYERNGNE